MARILDEGEAKHAPGSHGWLNLTAREHAIRALRHLDKFVVGAQNGARASCCAR